MSSKSLVMIENLVKMTIRLILTRNSHCQFSHLLQNRKLWILLGLQVFIWQLSTAQESFVSWTTSELMLNNSLVQRSIKLPAPTGSISTKVYKPTQGEFKYFEQNSPEFQFEYNGKVYSGLGEWTLQNIQKITDTKDGQGAAVTLLSQDKQVEITLHYLLYPQSPVLRKKLSIKNLSTSTGALESVDVENLKVGVYYPNAYSWVFSDYGRRRSLGPYEGNKQDALVMLYNPEWKQGIVIGNEAPGVLKRTAVFWETPEICAGLSHKNAAFPFRKWLKPGESFETPPIFTIVYNNQKDPDAVLNTAVPDFVRKHMGIRLSELTEKPTFVYNTWRPFKSNINESLIKELAAAAAAAGMKEFVIDDGWQDNWGDWGIDKQKFPNGLKPVFDYIKSLGMKPGLWVSVGSASPESKVYQEHPQWFVQDQQGKPTSLLLYGDTDKYTACFGTAWYQHIKTILSRLVSEYGLEYLKLDFAIVTSPYRFDSAGSGCYATGHPGHQDHHESLYTNYEFMWQLFDELHALNPKLFIDCTFETMGGLQLIDYAMLKHAEGDWLSNFYELNQDGDLRVRNMAWWRSPAMSATALVIGNLAMQDPGWETHIQSLAGALPIMLGDPRKLSPTDLKKYRGYADWLQAMAQRHDIMSYRQDLPGFAEPKEGHWDGFQRINTETRSGGIVGIFRHGARSDTQQVYLNYLDPNKTYLVQEAITGQTILRATGKQLAEVGFGVKIKATYGGQLFGVSAQ